MATTSSTAAVGNSSLRDLVTSLMVNDRAPRDRMVAQKAEATAQLKVYQDLGTQLSKLLTLTRPLSYTDRTNPLQKYAVTGNDTSVLDVTAEGNAPTGSHTIEVLQLASRQTLASASVVDTDPAAPASANGKAPSDTSPVAQDSVARIRLGRGGSSFEIEAKIAAGATKGQVLSALALAINDAHAGVKAMVMNVGGGSKRLWLQATEAGASGDITEIQDLQGNWMKDLGLSVSHGKNSAPSGVTTTGAEAVVLIDGVRVTAADNVLKDAIPGLTLTLKDLGKQTISVTRDKDAVVKQLQDFITEYNKTVDQVRSQTQAADKSGQGRGALAGDVGFARLRTGLRDAFNKPLTSGEGLTRITEMGLAVDRSGHLSISDAKTLQAALDSNPDQVDTLWRQIGSSLTTLLNGFSRFGGILAQDQRAMNDQIKRLDTRIAQQDSTLSRREDSLMNQMAQLQSSIGLLNQQKTYLSSLLASGDAAAAGL